LVKASDVIILFYLNVTFLFYFILLKAMGDLAAEGGKIFWVAPSGGRDRPDAATGEYVVAPFDGKALDMFKLVCMQSRKVIFCSVFNRVEWRCTCVVSMACMRRRETGVK
jgi:hypothetical protein